MSELEIDKKPNLSFESDIAPLLPLAQLPGRYSGGEYGAIPPLEGLSAKDPKSGAANLHIAVAFPDLYEIGMSNLAIKLIYRELNRIEGVRCERVFSVAPDFERLLRNRQLPLYSLESCIPLYAFDLLAVSVGYELAATSILSLLDLGGIPIERDERRENDPIVIAGGPALTNPAPFGRFFDGVYIGEGEELYRELTEKMKELKSRGGERAEKLAYLSEHPAIWTADIDGSGKFARRSVWRDFDSYVEGYFPVPNIDVVQDHGVVEIMRGCPNGCRFCHAGLLYRPYRRKSFDTIIREVDFQVRRLGYREITLSSLSSGDFSGLAELVRFLNERYGKWGVSFALPSLRINSFTLSLLQEISHVRKSGITFAVETPEETWQHRINKPVPVERVAEILEEARERGWNMAKFYFMIGLPPRVYGEEKAENDHSPPESSEAEREVSAIVEYVQEVRRRSGFKINANIGTFIPKPHTPYQWSRQLQEEESFRRLRKIKDAFKGGPVKITYHSPFTSFLEGVLSRGDERVGELILEAYRRGARLDAWEDYLSPEIWREVFEEAQWNVEEETCRARKLEEPLPWDSVDLGVSRDFILEEWEKSSSAELSGACDFPCAHHCGICVRGLKPREGENEFPDDLPEFSDSLLEEQGEMETNSPEDFSEVWFLIRFAKLGRSRFLSHINVMTIFERAFQRAGLQLAYSQGYNPKPRLEFAHPLTLGVETEADICRAKIRVPGSCPARGDAAAKWSKSISELLSAVFPEGIEVRRVSAIKEEYARGRGTSLMSKYAGSRFLIRSYSDDAKARQESLGQIEERAREIRSLIVEKEESTALSIRLRDGVGLELETGAAGERGKFLKKIMESYGGPGEFLSNFRVLRRELFAESGESAEQQRREQGESMYKKSDYFTVFVNM